MFKLGKKKKINTIKLQKEIKCVKDKQEFNKTSKKEQDAKKACFCL